MRSIHKPQNPEAGFSMLEAIVAVFVLTIGLIGTAAALSYAVHFGAISRNVTIAKGMVVSSIEDIETLRNSRRLSFAQIANVGNVVNTGSSVVFTGYVTDFQDISLGPGPDGVAGTADDLTDPGPDGVFGTPDDFVNPALVRSGYRRRVIITDLSSSMKKVEVTVQYFGSGGRVGEISGVAYLNDESRTTH
ncbi:MAG TPA: hypothetical protein PKM58_06830 [Pyrinomonadaceae bacterium]|nr:hypothetical protein [Pyrinomonadaceae bacterium]